MDFLGSIMGGGERRKDCRNFTNRYDEGAAYDRISGEEAISRYAEVAPNLSDDEYRDSAHEAFSRMDPEKRAQFGQQLREQADQQGYGEFIDRDHYGQDDRFQDPDYLTQMTGSIYREQPDMLGSLLGE